MKIAILDDYFSRAQSYANWNVSIGSHSSTRTFPPRELIEMLMPFDAVGLMRERTPFPRRSSMPYRISSSS